MNQKIKTLQIIHLAICAGTIIAYLTAGELSMNKLRIDSIDSSEMVYVGLPILALAVSSFLFKSQIKQIDPKLASEEKFPGYISASIIRWAILEGAAFALLFVKPDFMVFGILIIAYLAFLRPTEERFHRDFENSVQ